MIERLGIYIVLICGGLAWASEYFAVPLMASVAVLLFGSWVALWGVEVAFKGEVTLINSERRRYEFFSGIPAGLWSAIFITTGVGLIFLGWLDLSSPRGSEGFLDGFLNSPGGWGAIFGLAGMIVGSSGVIRMLAGSASHSERVSGLEELGFRVGGFLRALFGAILLVMAAGLMFAPDLLRAILDWMVEFLKYWLLG